MKQYELSYLITPDLSDQEVTVFCEKINSLIQDKGGVLGKMLAEKKIKLGYPIKKKATAFIKTVNFHLSPEKLPDLEKSLKETKEILRYFIVTPKEIKKPIEKELVFKASSKEVETKQKKEVKEKVELKDIDEKLKEIFEE